MSYYVYILQSVNHNRFYKGITQNLNRRLEEHNSRRDQASSKWKPYNLVWFGPKPNKSEAAKLERKLKNLSQVRTVEFIKKYPPPESDIHVEAVRI